MTVTIWMHEYHHHTFPAPQKVHTNIIYLHYWLWKKHNLATESKSQKTHFLKSINIIETKELNVRQISGRVMTMTGMMVPLTDTVIHTSRHHWLALDFSCKQPKQTSLTPTWTIYSTVQCNNNILMPCNPKYILKSITVREK